MLIFCTRLFVILVHMVGKYGNDLCSVDSSVGECRGNLCQRLEKIKFFHLGDTRKHGSEQIHDDLKTSHQTREKSRTF
jgi:hypothetical protein